MTATAQQVQPLSWPSDATLTMPGSKSEANRLLVAAALSGRRVRITGATPCDDVRHLVGGLAALGHEAHFVDERTGVVHVGPRRPDAPVSGTLHCGNAGTALRFLVSVAAVTKGEWTVTGDARMQQRPIAPLVAAWRRLGADVADTDGCPPVRVRGGCRAGGSVHLDASVSSQFLSSLLLVGGNLDAGLEVHLDGPLASADYARLTQRVLARCGVHTTSVGDRSFVVRPGFAAMPDELAVAGDWSAMGVWRCLEFLDGSCVRATNLQAGSGQADERLAELLPLLEDEADHTLDVAAVPDQFLNLAVVAALRPATTRLVGAANLRSKECDRLAVMTRELRAVGARVEELADGLAIHGGEPLHGATIDPEHDHRVAMAFALLGLLVPGIAIADADCVAKSYPTFWADLDAVRAARRCVAVVGMRGAGKSTFAKAFAARTGCRWVDTDDAFEVLHGPIAAFVEAHGWPRFRDLEAQIVAASLVPGAVVSTGGGAIEDPATCALLHDRALTVWLDGEPDLLRSRLLAHPGNRPSLTGAPVLHEIREVLHRRNPLYDEVAVARIDAAAPTGNQVERVLQLLSATGRFAYTRMPRQSP